MRATVRPTVRPAGRSASSGSAAPEARGHRSSARLGRLPGPVLAWLAVLCGCVAVLVVDRVHPLPPRVAPGVAVALGVALVLGLAVRTGGRPWVPVLLSGGWAVAAVVTLAPLLLAGAAVGVAVAAAALAVMGTVPAPRVRGAAREVVLATLLTTAAGLGVAALAPRGELVLGRFTYLVLGASLLACFGLVYRLGAGFHGLGRRGYAVAAGAAMLLAVVLAYSEAVGRWGSPVVIAGIDDVRTFLRAHLGAVPHPLDTLLGVPALCWGTFMRARRRQGWWVCAFGAAATAPATTRFLFLDAPGPTTALSTVLGALYSLLIGLALGLLVVRMEQAVVGSRGRRARHDEEAAAHRPEPARFEPLQ